MTPNDIFSDIISNSNYNAIAWINGGETASELNGSVKFYSTPYKGVLIIAEIFGLPDKLNLMNNTSETNNIADASNHSAQNFNNPMQNSGFFGMHIHEYGDCTLPFDKTGDHYNPFRAEHPYHVGDLPPLLSNNGYAFMAVYDNRFSVEEIIGKSVIIHSNADDFVSQPSGNSGSKIGCGVIEAY